MASDPQLYARSFADVYQAWYGDLDDPALLVNAVSQRCPAGAHILELGSGTGRLATPLHQAGFRVIALDASLDMLLDAPAGPLPVGADMAELPLGEASIDATVIAYNTLLNLPEAAQRRCLHELSRVLRPGGLVAIEAFIADTTPTSAFGVTIRDHPQNPEARLAIITGPDAENPSALVGSHIELGPSLACRPWRLQYQSPNELDRCAHDAGLTLLERSSDWAGTAFDPDGHRHVSWYRRI